MVVISVDRSVEFSTVSLGLIFKKKFIDPHLGLQLSRLILMLLPRTIHI